MNAPLDTPDANLFEQVGSDYAHVRKVMRPAPPLVAPDVYQKWYLVHPPERPFSDAEVKAAQSFLRREIDAGRLALRNEVGFTVQHRCSAMDIFYVCSWRGNNELWETLYHLPPGSLDYQLVPRDTKTGTYCVWVIPAVTHEQRAWLTYLNSSRDAAARLAYCQDQASGDVG